MSVTSPQRQAHHSALGPAAMAWAAAWTEPLQALFQDFWGGEPRLRVFSAGVHVPYWVRHAGSHAAAIRLEGPGRSQLMTHLAAQTGLQLLSASLGERPRGQAPADLSQISPLEHHLFRSFSEKLLTSAKRALLPGHGLGGRTVHLVWLCEVRPGQALGWVQLSVPSPLIPPLPEPDEPPPPLSEAFFLDRRRWTRLCLGFTRASLQELDTLEPGDVVLLETSHAGWLAWMDTGGEPAWIPVTWAAQPPDCYPETLPERLRKTTTPMTDAESAIPLWDQLQVDVRAEFRPIPMPLSEVKRMAEGLLIEVGDLMHHEVRLHIDGKTLAVGELVLVEDQFAVRIRQLMAPRETAVRALPQTSSASAPPPAPVEAAAAAPVQDTIQVQTADLDEFLNDDFSTDVMATPGVGGEEEAW